MSWMSWRTFGGCVVRDFARNGELSMKDGGFGFVWMGYPDRDPDMPGSLMLGMKEPQLAQ